MNVNLIFFFYLLLFFLYIFFVRLLSNKLPIHVVQHPQNPNQNTCISFELRSKYPLSLCLPVFILKSVLCILSLERLSNLILPGTKLLHEYIFLVNAQSLKEILQF